MLIHFQITQLVCDTVRIWIQADTTPFALIHYIVLLSHREGIIIPISSSDCTGQAKAEEAAIKVGL